MNEPVSPSEFLIISRGLWDPAIPPEKIQETIDQFYLWISRHVEEGRMKRGQRLGTEGKMVTNNGITDGPFGETKEVIGGFWTIVAGSLKEAAAIAEGNPCLKCGLFCEIRPIIDPRQATAFMVTNETPLDRREKR